VLVRSFYVGVEKTLNHLYFNFLMVFHKVLYLVLHSSLYAPLFFAQSHQIHQQMNFLLAHDTQLFLSVSAADFSSNITDHENTVQCLQLNDEQCFSNILSLNLSKTEFLIFGLLNNFLSSEILPSNASLTSVNCGHNLGVIFAKYLTFSQHISAISNSCLYNIRDPRCICYTIDQPTACTFLHPLSILMVTNVTFFCSISLSVPPCGRAQLYRLSTVDAHTDVLKPIHGKII